MSKTNGGPSYHEWPAAEFVGRVAALGPRSPLRSAVTAATRSRATTAELEAGYGVTPAAKVTREARRAAGAAGRAWAACMRKIFEVDPVKCVKCTGEMKHVSVILDDRELDRILAHQGWPTEFPKTKASRAPPGRVESGGESSQVDPRAEKWEGKDEIPDEEPS
ncbi:MAG TPA: hypothetical protein PK867_11950 [Pirellulales bacterium]|nr:hypothetical protein [Pirellulales bacterium]